MRMERLSVLNLCSSKRGSFRLSTATRFLTLGAATVISCLLISIGMYQYRQAAKLANQVNHRISELSQWLTDEELIQYERSKLSGTEVINFYILYFAECEVLPDFQMILCQDDKEYLLDSSELLEQLQCPDTEIYCAPRAVYVCNVIKNRNELIVEIRFEKQ